MPNHIELKNVGLSFSTNNNDITLFNQLSLSIKQGHSYAITGPSGAGKSSLLMLASGLEKPTRGHISYVKNNRISSLGDLRKECGFIFQQFHLLPELTALNNVALPLKLRGDRQATSIAEAWLNKVGLGHRKDHKPSELSGGEQQRVAIARALVFKPKFIFADEPTGNLDPKSAHDVANLLIDCCNENGAGLILVTHSHELAHRTEHVYALNNGQLTSPLATNVESLSC